LHQLQQAIAPQLELGFVLGHWNEIAAALAKRDRERVAQLALRHLLSWRLWGFTPGRSSPVTSGYPAYPGGQ